MCIILPVTIVATPANAKRTPAKRIIAAVAPDLILKRLYPSFILGKALPPKTQYIIAKVNTTAPFEKYDDLDSSFIILPPLNI